MMTRYEVWLDKKSLSAIDPAIYILDISYGATHFLTTTHDKPGRNGQRVTGRQAQNTSVTVAIEIRERDIARRQDICRRVHEWAILGGMLTTNDRRGQRLAVICDNPPSIGSALKWTQTLKMTFTAYEQPFWEDEYPRAVTIAGKDAEKSLYVGGFGVLARVEAEVKNTSSKTVDALTLKAGGTTFEFAKLGLTAGGTLEIGYDKNDLLYIQTGDESKMHCRTAASDDELMVCTGTAEKMGVHADNEVSVTFKARRLYL